MPRFKFCPRCATALVERPDAEGDPRRACPAEGCGFVHYDNPTPVAAIIVEHEGHVVLARNARWPPKMFSVITGFVERGEHPSETAVRETAEELGLTPGPATLVGIYDFKPMNQVIIAYHVEATGEIELGVELAEFKRVPIEKLRPWPIGPGPAVADWLARRRAAAP